MAYEVFLDGNKLTLTDEQIEQIETICGVNSEDFLTTKTINELSGLSFLIKDYQRGYRWTRSEVQDLLNDIDKLDLNDEHYCMQPLVVKLSKDLPSKIASKLDGPEISTTETLPDDTYELLDGQQRLTTIYLIASFLEEPSLTDYTIYYELTRNVDLYYIKQASDTIRNWFKENSKFNKSFTPTEKKCKNKSGMDWKDEEKSNFITKFKKLYFIWYEVKDSSISAEKIFKSINEGKIELTNAELFKALLLNPDNLINPNDLTHYADKLQQIAFEWDKLEMGLRDDDFWYFISQNDVENSIQKTRIDYIIEVYARELNNTYQLGLSPHKDRFSFLAIQKYLESQEKENYFTNLKKIWEEIVSVYDRLYSWYKDYELYHTIGFLVASEDINRGSKAVVSDSISDLYQVTKKKNINEIQLEVRKMINKQLIVESITGEEIDVENILYEYPPDARELVNKSTLRKILLFTNIYAFVFYKCNEDSMDKNLGAYVRFPFKHYNQIKHDKGWDIEHVSPKTIEKDLEKACSCYNVFKENIIALKNDLDPSDPNADLISIYLKKDCNDSNYKSQDEYSKIINLWKNYAEELSQNPDNNIGNLVLLNASINRSYGNAFFNKKRQKIIENDQRGVFIPICTKNVFMKYYSDTLSNPTQWTEIDKEKYKDFIKTMLNEIKGWNDENR